MKPTKNITELSKKELRRLNLTNQEYSSLTNAERLFLNDTLPSNIWEFHSEAHPKTPKPELPCIIDGVIIGE